MKYIIVAAIVSALASSPALAFTNGTNLPSYFCHPGFGLPASLGPLLSVINKTNPPAATAIAGFHNSPDLMARPNLVNVRLESVATGMLQSTIVAGCDYRLVVNTTNGQALDGLIIWGEVSPIVKVGHFVELGPTMSIWPACGPGRVGAVHHQVVSETTTYNQLVWRAPLELSWGEPGSSPLGFSKWSLFEPPAPQLNIAVQFRGVTDTDGGFGTWINDVVFPFTTNGICA
ncbi:Reelin domain-containing protein [Plasmodiophora brassicae]|uniref:Reelin domain-containing protein n=1 Tax=Plasmodiophora brassicae TaxID=37360 RepID=A0A0G4J1A2_PLABS|nr:hypothetical protein PBRA_001883 [Plasmodiophora brassicae]SPR01313.1 unnamed protein product [Plasmodiophora brassicae]